MYAVQKYILHIIEAQSKNECDEKKIQKKKKHKRDDGLYIAPSTSIYQHLIRDDNHFEEKKKTTTKTQKKEEKN